MASSEREVDGDAAAAEVDQGDQWGGGVKAEAAVADQSNAAVEAFEAAVGQPEADRGEDARAVAAQRAGGLDERGEPGARGPANPGVQVRRRERRIFKRVEQPQLVVEQEGAVEPAVADVDLAERAELVEVLAVGRLEQRPARVLDPAPGGGVRALVRVPRRGEPGRRRRRRRGRRGRGRTRSRPAERPGESRADSRRSCRSRPPGSTAGVAELSSACKVALLRPFRTQTIRPLSWSATTVK